MKKRQNAGKRARFAEMEFRVNGFEIRLEKPRRQTVCPFVEISRDYSVSGKFFMFQNIRVKQLVNLPTTFEKRSSQMQIEKL